MEYTLISERDDRSIIETLMSNRGITNFYHYINTTNADINSFNLFGIDKLRAAAQMLFETIQKGESIALLVDSDLDGYFSSALAANYLYKIFPNYTKNNVKFIYHELKVHGLKDTVEEIIKLKPGLVWSPDGSSGDIEEHLLLEKNNIKCIITDHHEYDQEVETPAIIINSRSDTYPNKFLCGTGVTWQFCKYIDSLLGETYSEDLIDMVAVATIVDMMDLREYENKRLIDIGLDNINNEFLKTIIKAQDYSIKKHGGLDPFSVGFYIGPMVNAITRVGTIEEKKIIFNSLLDINKELEVPSTKRGCKGELELLVEQAVRTCTNVKNRQQRTRDSSLETVENIISKFNLENNKIIAVCLDKDHAIDKALTGLVATQIANKYGHPTLILNDNNEEWSGSGRGVSNIGFDDFRGFVDNSGYSLLAQGHPPAFGAAFEKSKIQDFVTYANKELKNCNFSSSYKVDFIYDGNNFNGKEIIEIAELKSLWGQEMPEPYIAIENLNITKNNITLLSPDKNPTLKITLSNGVEIMKFKSSKEEFESFTSNENGCITINLVAKCSINNWMGNIKPQLLIEDYEVIKKQQYYF